MSPPPPTKYYPEFHDSLLNSDDKQWTQNVFLKKLRGLSPQANYTDRATAACPRS
jgi:hypothetical protein